MLEHFHGDNLKRQSNRITYGGAVRTAFHGPPAQAGIEVSVCWKMVLR